MSRKITETQQRQKDRLAVAYKELNAVMSEHQCFLASDGDRQCCICNKLYADGKFNPTVRVAGKFLLTPAPATAGAAKPAAPKPPLMECFCPKDQDGECLRCKGILSDAIGQVTGLISRTIAEFKKITQSFSAPGCQPCGHRYVDYGIAKAFKGVFGQLGSKEIAQEVLQALFKVMGQEGVTEVPLTRKAWADLCQENGWL